MRKARELAVLFITLFLFWVLLNGTLANDVLLVGFVASLVITLMFQNGLALFSEFRWTPKSIITLLLYVLFFLKELVKSNVSLAKIVLSPVLPLKPGIVKVRTRLKSRMGRLLLTNSITLTPGTLTVDIVGEWLYIHWVTVDSTDIDEATAAIVGGFERYLEVMYG